MGGNSRNLTAFSLPFAGTTKLYGCTTRPCLSCYPSRKPLKSATTSTTRANPAKGCHNLTCPVPEAITTRHPHLCLPRYTRRMEILRRRGHQLDEALQAFPSVT